jgi:hypothetical protein
VPIGPGGGPPEVFLPIVRMGHHGLPPDVVSDDPQHGLELFTVPWHTLEDTHVDAAGVQHKRAPAYIGPPVTAGEIIARIQAHHDQTHIRVAVPCVEGTVHSLSPNPADKPHHRILYFEDIGFAQGSVPSPGGVLPVSLITEGWESLAGNIRVDEE